MRISSVGVLGILAGVVAAQTPDHEDNHVDTKTEVVDRAAAHGSHPIAPLRRKPAPHQVGGPVEIPSLHALIEPDPFGPVDEMLTELRKEWLNPIALTFNPSAGVTYQHATKVRDGYPHGRSYLWYGWSGDLTLWDDDQGLGQMVYNAAGNTGLGTSTEPYMGVAVGNPDYSNNILVANRIGLYMLYWQQAMFDHKVRFRVGKFEDQVFFDNNTIAYDPVSGFLAENFNEQIVMPFPNYAFGVNLEWDVADDLILRAGTLNSNNTGNNSGFQGLSWNNLFTTAEADLTIRVPFNGRDRVGHWRLTGWWNSTPDPLGPGQVEGGGICVNMDQEISDVSSVFMRLGWGENQATRSNFAVSTGIAFNHPFGLKGHHTGIAFEYAKITAYGRAEVGLPTRPGEQYMAEWYWRVKVSESFNIGPVVQAVRDVTAGIDTSIIWGVRSSWSF
ncbi:MAG: carbohydrate porin [Phycisphaerales bacterium]|nr:carbohydrate porin [Phycisphaerales bacterium]